MTDPALPSADLDGPSVAPPPGPILQSATIGFRVIYIITLVLGVIWFGSNFRVISSDNQAVVMRFGRIARTQKAGLLLAWPRPIEQVLMLPGPERQLSREVKSLPAVDGIAKVSTDGSDTTPPGAAPYLTGDGKVVLLDATLIYRINDATAFVLSQSHVAPAVDRMFRASAVRVAAGQNLNDFLVTQSSDSETGAQSIEAIRGAVRDRLLTSMNTRLKALSDRGDGLGVEIDRIDMTAWLPPQAKVSFDAVLTAGQKADQNIAAANTAAERRRQGAQREADRLLSAAQAVALERTVTATVDTTSIVAIERTAGSHAGLAQQAYRNTIGTVLGKAGAVVAIDAKSSQRVLLTGPGRR